MFSALVGSFLLLLLYNRFFAVQTIEINIIIILVFLYTLLHMAGAVLEVNFGRHNKNHYIFIMSLVACTVYMGLIFIVGVINTTTLAAYMVVYMLLYDSLLAYAWRKKL